MQKKLILTIGHSVVRTDNGQRIPSPLYQEITRPGGPDGKMERTHVHRPDLDPNAENAYLGGGQAVVEALHCLWHLDPIVDVAIVGGRPASMERFGAEIATITEASVMAEYFAPSGFTIDVIGETRNTEEDMREVLALAAMHDRTCLVAMGFRLPRVRLYLREAALSNPKFIPAARTIDLIGAEQFLPLQFDDLVAMHRSAAYARTMSQERFDVRRLLGVN